MMSSPQDLAARDWQVIEQRARAVRLGSGDAAADAYLEEQHRLQEIKWLGDANLPPPRRPCS